MPIPLPSPSPSPSPWLYLGWCLLLALAMLDIGRNVDGRSWWSGSGSLEAWRSHLHEAHTHHQIRDLLIELELGLSSCFLPEWKLRRSQWCLSVATSTPSPTQSPSISVLAKALLEMQQFIRSQNLKSDFLADIQHWVHPILLMQGIHHHPYLHHLNRHHRGFVLQDHPESLYILLC